MKYTTDMRSHSLYSLQFHYISCTKYRKKIFTDIMALRLKEIHLSVAKAFEIKIIEQEVVSDHVHILFASKPKTQISKFINSLKSVSGRLIFREFPEVKKQLYKNHLWSASYFIASTGDVTLDILKKYVESQNA